MRKIFRILIAATILCAAGVDVYANSAIYACGHIRREREKAIPALKNSGYTTAIIFNVTVESDGTLTTDYDWGNKRPAEAGGVICSDGKYVFDEYQPYFVDDVKSLLEAPTSISRLEFCIGGWGNGSYGNIKRLIDSQGVDENSILYRNFKALKEAIPEVMAINDDQEQDYDVAAATAFHRMLSEVGFKTTIAPYTQRNFWQQLVANLNADTQICDLVYLQTYGGGAGNNPNDWKVFGDIPMYVGFDNEASDDIATMTARFTNWRDNAGAVGGFVWNYNNENRNLNQWATAINRVFPPVEVTDAVVTVYSQSNYAGGAYQLPAGEFSQGELSLYGVQARELSSFELNEGYVITLYSGENFNGDSKAYEESTSNVGLAWRGRTCSIVIASASSGVEGLYKADGGMAEVFDLQGRVVARVHPGSDPADFVRGSSLPKGVYIIRDAERVVKVTK